MTSGCETYLDIDDRCIFCGEDNPSVLQAHHVVPRRFNGSDRGHNLITLCANCHELIEKIYNDNFYRNIAKEFGMCEYCGEIYPDVDSHIFNTGGGGHGTQQTWP